MAEVTQTVKIFARFNKILYSFSQKTQTGSQNVRIAVDAMGGDFAPREIIEGAILAQAQLGVYIALVGDREILANYLKQHNYQESDHLEIVP